MQVSAEQILSGGAGMLVSDEQKKANEDDGSAWAVVALTFGIGAGPAAQGTPASPDQATSAVLPCTTRAAGSPRAGMVAQADPNGKAAGWTIAAALDGLPKEMSGKPDVDEQIPTEATDITSGVGAAVPPVAMTVPSPAETLSADAPEGIPTDGAPAAVASVASTTTAENTALVMPATEQVVPESMVQPLANNEAADSTAIAADAIASGPALADALVLVAVTPQTAATPAQDESAEPVGGSTDSVPPVLDRAVAYGVHHTAANAQNNSGPDDDESKDRDDRAPEAAERASPDLLVARREPFGKVIASYAPDMPREELSARLAQQVAARFSMLPQAGEKGMRIQLDPPSLGHLDVSVLMGSDGISVQMRAQSSLVRDSIESNLPLLKAALADQGINADRVTVDVTQQTGAAHSEFRGQSQHSWPQQRGGNTWLGAEPTEPSWETDGLLPGGYSRPSTLIDYLI